MGRRKKGARGQAKGSSQPGVANQLLGLYKYEWGWKWNLLNNNKPHKNDTKMGTYTICFVDGKIVLTYIYG